MLFSTSTNSPRCIHHLCLDLRDILAISQQGVRHATTQNQHIYTGHQIFQNLKFGRHLGTLDNGRHRCGSASAR